MRKKKQARSKLLVLNIALMMLLSCINNPLQVSAERVSVLPGDARLVYAVEYTTKYARDVVYREEFYISGDYKAYGYVSFSGAVRTTYQIFMPLPEYLGVQNGFVFKRDKTKDKGGEWTEVIEKSGSMAPQILASVDITQDDTMIAFKSECYIPIFKTKEAYDAFILSGKISNKNEVILPPGFIVDEDGNIGEIANNQLNPVNDNKSIPTPKNLSMTREKFQDVYSKAEYIQDYQLNFILKKTKLADYLTGDYSDTKQGSTVSRTTWKSATDFVDNADITTFSLHLCADIEYSYKKDGATITKKTGYVWYGDDIMTTKQALTLSNEDMKQYIQGIQTGATLKNIYYYYVGYVPEKNTYAKGNSVKIALQDSPWDAEARPPVEYEEEDPDGETVDGEYTDKVTDGKTGEDGITTPRPGYKPGIDETIKGTKSLLDNIGQLPQLLAHLFTFIPKDVWTIFIIGVSFLVGVGILKIVF